MNEHDKYMIPCIKHDGHYFKFCILRSIVLKQFRKSEGLCQTFLQVMLGHMIKLLQRQKQLFSFQNKQFLYFLTSV